MTAPRQSDITRALKAVRAGGLTVYAVNWTWREESGRQVQQCEIVTHPPKEAETQEVSLG